MKTTPIQTCIAWTSRREFRNNLPCGNKARPGSSYCGRHDPALLAEKDAAATAERERRWKAAANDPKYIECPDCGADVEEGEVCGCDVDETHRDDGEDRDGNPLPGRE